MKATFTIAQQVTVNLKQKWWKPSVPQVITHHTTLTIVQLTDEEAMLCHDEFPKKLVGLFTNGHVVSVKIEHEEELQ